MTLARMFDVSASVEPVDRYHSLNRTFISDATTYLPTFMPGELCGKGLHSE